MNQLQLEIRGEDYTPPTVEEVTGSYVWVRLNRKAQQRCLRVQKSIAHVAYGPTAAYDSWFLFRVFLGST